MFTTPGSPVTPSTLRDIERDAPIEADHIVGDLIRRGEAQSCTCPLLHIAYAHLKTYQADGRASTRSPRRPRRNLRGDA
ncbi:MAG TPA: ketopantoate reductase C-terminal domain-containing protein [Xanthobacteraceae bacterium]|jgi:2-dehydropantoate 2-reductase